MVRWVAPGLAVLAVLAAGLFAGGPAGLVVVATLVAGLGVVRAWGAGPPPLPLPRRPRGAVAGPADFPSYRDIRGRVSWGRAGRRHFDTSTRPMLWRLFAAVAAERHRVDVDRDRTAARELLGAELWELLDPDRPAATDSGAPGVDTATVARIVDRLEET